MAKKKAIAGTIALIENATINKLLSPISDIDGCCQELVGDNPG
jgi:hypothetical protein